MSPSSSQNSERNRPQVRIQKMFKLVYVLYSYTMGIGGNKVVYSGDKWRL